MDYGIFNVRTNVNACDFTRGCTDIVRESALKVDSWRKIPCRTGKLNLCRQRAGPMLYQLSYIPTPPSALPERSSKNSETEEKEERKDRTCQVLPWEELPSLPLKERINYNLLSISCTRFNGTDPRYPQELVYRYAPPRPLYFSSLQSSFKHSWRESVNTRRNSLASEPVQTLPQDSGMPPSQTLRERNSQSAFRKCLKAHLLSTESWAVQWLPVVFFLLFVYLFIYLFSIISLLQSVSSVCLSSANWTLQRYATEKNKEARMT